MHVKFSPLAAVLALSFAAGSAPAQSTDPAVPYASLGHHKHDGFYLSMNIGPAFGGTILTAKGSDAQSITGGNEIIYRGQGVLLDFKIGGAIRENLILSFDIIGRTITGPEMEVDGTTVGTASDDIVASDNTLGVGMTYYFMPHNVFVSGTVGMGTMTVENKDTDSKGESKAGLGLHFKVGKEWWVSKNWGLGISGGYGFIAAKDKAPPAGVDYDATLKSHQLYVLFNTTFN